MDFRLLTENALTLALSHRNGRGEFSEASGPDVCLFLTLAHLWRGKGKGPFVRFVSSWSATWGVLWHCN
jgi:hypothetical protein